MRPRDLGRGGLAGGRRPVDAASSSSMVVFCLGLTTQEWEDTRENAVRHLPCRMRHSPAAAPATPPKQQDAVYRELRPGTGKGASVGAGPLRRATRPAAGRARDPPTPTPAPPPQPHTSPANNNRPEEMRTSCRQQPAPPPSDAAKMSPCISIGPEPVLAAHAPSPSAAGSHCPVREGSTLH